MYVGALEADVLLPPVTSSLKGKRGMVKPLLAELRRRFEVSCSEVADVDVPGRLRLGVAAVSGDAGHLQSVLDRCERFLDQRPEITLLSVRRRVFRPDD